MAKSGPIIPKNVQKLATRTLILLFLVAAGVFGIQWWLGRKGDLDLGGADTKDMILALHLTPDGQRAAVVKGDGSIVESAGFTSGATDRDATWNPSGNRVFFVSDRSGKAFHVYRWNPERNSDPEQRTVDNSGRSAPFFDNTPDAPKADATLLITARGNVEELNPSETRAQRVLPPPTRDIVNGEEGGGVGSFEALYQRYGTSFRLGRWCHGRQFIAAIMRREQGGEVLLLQSIVPNERGSLSPPVPVVAGEHLEIDVAPNGNLVFDSQAFDFATDAEREAATKGNKIVRPWRHMLGFVEFENDRPKPGVISASKDDQQAYGRLAVSPDGTKVIAVVGPYEDGVHGQSVVSFPVQAQGAAAAAEILRGEVDQPSFSKKGDQIVYVRRQGNERGIYVAGADGSGERALTTGKGDFAEPKFSPQH